MPLMTYDAKSIIPSCLAVLLSPLLLTASDYSLTYSWLEHLPGTLFPLLVREASHSHSKCTSTYLYALQELLVLLARKGGKEKLVELVHHESQQLRHMDRLEATGTLIAYVHTGKYNTRSYPPSRSTLSVCWLMFITTSLTPGKLRKNGKNREREEKVGRGGREERKRRNERGVEKKLM